jgi:hypothetical protein
MQRRVLGIIAAALLGAGLIGSFTSVLGADSLWWGGVTLRSGAILGCLWLVMPRVSGVPVAVWVGGGVFAVFLAVRPRLILFGLAASFVAMVIVAVARRRTSQSG